MSGTPSKLVAFLQRILDLTGVRIETRLMMTMVYSESGRLEDARAEAEEVLRINPKFSLDKWEKAITGSNKEQSIAAIRRAGLK